jgi:hypothetical protein
MESHQPYREIFKRVCDFRVKYEFLPLENPSGYRFYTPSGEPRRLVYQGTRFDFRYADDAGLRGQGFMIWPEFEDPGGFLVLAKSIPIEPSGTARMWIVSRNFVEFHKQHLQIGTPGYMVAGAAKVASCEVIELIGLG